MFLQENQAVAAHQNSRGKNSGRVSRTWCKDHYKFNTLCLLSNCKYSEKAAVIGSHSTRKIEKLKVQI